MYGGLINSKANDNFNPQTGGDLSDHYARLNFNDILNSIYYQLVCSFCADSLTLYKMVIANADTPWLAGVFFSLFYLVGILVVLNIILGTILGFITTYLGITEEEEMEKEK